MQAIGMVETKGLVAAIETSDAMLKAADVTLLDRTFVKGGLVNITVTGEVSAVKASVDAGAASVQRLGEQFLISTHVIPRPHESLEACYFKVSKGSSEPPKNDPPKGGNLKKEEKSADSAKDEDLPTKSLNIDDIHKDDLDNLVSKNKDSLEEILGGLRVVKLRNLAREYDGFEIAGREISKADKATLIEEFKKFYR